MFREGGVGMFFDGFSEGFILERFFASWLWLWSEASFFLGVEVTVNRLSDDLETTCGVGFCAAALNELNDARAQIQRVGFHEEENIA